jgi:amidase
VSTFITRLDSEGSGPRLAVKDIIDVEGVPTTGASRALERVAEPADRDAACLAGARAADARIVGKVNLHELAVLPLGTNPWFGTPVNPLDAALIPGGSSSGSAVAVANDEADVALGSDTGGSIRVPSACCGTSGLKTTHGRVPLDGVWPLAPSLDTIGPMAAKVDGLVLGMQLLEPGFEAALAPARTIGRLKSSGDSRLEAAVDDALRAAELEVVELEWSEFEAGTACFTAIYFNEFWESDRELLESDPEGIGEDVTQAFAMAQGFRAAGEQDPAALQAWSRSLHELFDRVELLALPTLPISPPRIDSLNEETLVPTVLEITRNVALFNAAGVPATAQPVTAAGAGLPGSLQLVGPLGGEELLLATAAHIEAAVG